MPSKYYDKNITQVQPVHEQTWGQKAWGENNTNNWIDFGMLPSWRSTFDKAELNEATKVDTWMKIRPAYPVPGKANGAVFSHINSYDSAFENTIWSLRPLNALGPIIAMGAKPGGELDLLLKNTEKYFQDLGRGDGDTGLPLQLVYLLGKDGTDSNWAMDTARAWAKAYRAPPSEEKPEAISEWQRSVYEFYGKLWGIPFKALPTGPSKLIRKLNDGELPSAGQVGESLVTLGAPAVYELYKWKTALGWGDIFGPWSDPDTQNMDSFQDVLLYLYLKPENDRGARLASLQEDLDALPAAVDIPEDAYKAIKTRATYRLTDKIKKNKALSKSDKRALRALRDKNDDYFKSVSRQATQCILRMNLLSYTTAHALNPGSFVNNIDGSLNYINSDKQPYFNKKRYHKSIYLDYGNSASLINKLTFSPYGDSFINIRTDEISQLLPMIRIYKSAHEDGKLTSETEFKFDGGPGADPLEDRPGVGIKSFDWTLNATNPATIRNDIEAKLVLYFQDFAELDKVRTGYDVVSGKQLKFRYQDLLLRPPVTGITTLAPSKSTKSSKSISEACNEKRQNNLDQKFYEIKALVGWSDPGVIDHGPVITLLDQQKLIKSIKNQQLSMFLNLIDHSFNITQEGTFELEITYRGRLAALATDPRMDVLTTPDQKEKIDKLLGEIEEAQKECDSQSDVDFHHEEISRIRELDRDALGSAILNGMSDKIYITKINQWSFNQLVLNQAEERITKIDGKNPFIIGPQDVVDSINETDNALVPTARSAFERRLIDSRSPSHPDYDAAEEKKRNAESEGHSLELGYLTGDKNVHIPWFYFGDLVDVVVGHLMVEAPGKEGAQGVVPTIEMKNLSFLFGNFPVQIVNFSPEGGFKIQDVFNVNIADVPITLEMFNVWYAKKVIIPDRQTYSILEFLRDICDDLVRATLNRNCFEGNLARQWAQLTPGDITIKDTPLGQAFLLDQTNFYEIPDLIFKTTSVSLPGLRTGTTAALKEKDLNTIGDNPLENFKITLPRVSSTAANGSGDDRSVGGYTDVWINSDEFAPPGDALGGQQNLVSRKENSHDQTIKNSYHLMVFYFVNDDSYRKFGPPQNGLTRYERDLNEGVYHLLLGADSGIFKSVQFSKTDAPFLREARIQQAQLDPLSQLAATYDVTLKLIGNTLCWPGQYIFINPIGFGTGFGRPDDVGSISNALGLGGYHLITGVKNYIEEGKYETEVTARFEFSGDGCPSLPGATTPPCED